MTIAIERVKATATQQAKVQFLRDELGYPVMERDSQDGNWWYLRAGKTKAEAQETCPIAVRCLPELEGLSDRQIKQRLTKKGKSALVTGHYLNRTFESQPVLYLLLPGGIVAVRCLCCRGKGESFASDKSRRLSWARLS